MDFPQQLNLPRVNQDRLEVPGQVLLTKPSSQSVSGIKYFQSFGPITGMLVCLIFNIVFQINSLPYKPVVEGFPRVLDLQLAHYT